MKNNLLSLLLMVGVLAMLLPLCSAQIYQTGQVVQLKFTCTINNAIPSNSATFNLSIDSPDGSTYLALTPATSLGQGLFNYSVIFNNSGLMTIHEFCYDGSLSNSNSEEVLVNLSGTEVSAVDISIYIIFLLISLGLVYLSILLIKRNPVEKDLTDSEMYEVKKRNEFTFYLKVLKKKMWILGVFGVYLSILLFISIFSNLTANLSLSDLFSISGNLLVILLWGLIPFVVFWFIYIIIFFYQSIEKTMRYQFGRMGGRNERN